MIPTRPDLDGLRLFVPGRSEIWIVFHGVRHYIASPAVHQALFSTAQGHRAVRSVDGVRRGADLNDGSCLVRGDGEDQGIYLLTGFPSNEVRRHHIASWETFLAFGFDEQLVRSTPALFLGLAPLGRELRSSGLERLPYDLQGPLLLPTEASSDGRQS